MNIVYFGILQFVTWSAFYTLTTMLKDEKFILAAFAVAAVVSMITAAAFGKRQ